MRQVFLLSISITILLLGQASGTTWYVNDTVSFPGDGRSWMNAFRTIQEGIDASSDGDTVRVAQGTYVENIQLKGKNIVLTGTDPLNPNVVAETIIDGNQAGSVVTLDGTEDGTCVLSGFTICNGSADDGGGIHGGRWPDLTSATIQNNMIVGNWAKFDGGGLYRCCGAVQDNTITDNSASNYAGGGLSDCSGTIQNNTISLNFGPSGGGLAYCGGTIQNNTITSNSAEWGGGLSGCNGTIQNNTITSNSARYGGGLDDCGGTIRNNTIAGNGAYFYGGGLKYCDGTIQNCVIWGNKASSDAQLATRIIPTYSCIQDWTWGGEGNIALDPQFVDPVNMDYHLSPGSPCIDAGENEDWMADAVDLDGNPRIIYGTVDMGAYEYGSFRFTIVDVERMSGNGLTLTWTSRPGDTYDVFVTYRLSGMGWALDSRVPSQGEQTTWSSGSMPSSSVFFKVALH